MDPKRVQTYQRDVVLWAEENIAIRNPTTGRVEALKLEEHQRQWLRMATARSGRDGWGPLVYRTVVASWPKREGKSLCVAILVAHRLCLFVGQRCIILANSERQAASVIYEEVVALFRNSPTLAQYVTEDDIETRKIIVRGLGNEAICVPCNYRTVQGIAVTGILACDELHAAQDVRAYTYLAAQTESSDAQIAVSSQAGAPVNSNPVYRMYRASDVHVDGSAIHFSYLDHHITPWAIALGERDRNTLLPAEWDLLHGNAWAGQGVKLFDPRHVELAARDYQEPRSADEWRELVAAWGMIGRPFRIGVGLDRAGIRTTGDRTVWVVTAHFVEGDNAGRGAAHDGDTESTETAGERRGGGTAGVFAVVMCRVLQTGSEAEVLAVDRETREVFGHPDRGMLEYYNCSDLVGKLAGATLETPTIQRQQGLFNRLYRLVSEGRFWFPTQAGIAPRTRTPGLLKEELIEFEYSAERVGLTRYGTQSGHDDTVYGAAWSCEAADVPEMDEVEGEGQGELLGMDDLIEGWAPAVLGAARL